MNLIFLSMLGVRMAFSGLSDTLVNVVVSASRQPMAIQRAPLAISKRKVANQQLMNTPEFFQQSTGVFVQRTNQGGGSVFVRGLTGNQTLLVLDGIRFNNSTFRYGPNQYLNTIDPFNLSAVEIVKGSGSVQYGSDALTGAVQLFTEKPEFASTTALHGEILGRWTSQGMETSGLGKVQYQSANTAFSVHAGMKSFGDITRGGDGEFQRPTGYEEQNLLFQFRQKLGSNWIFENIIQQNQQDHVPVYHKVSLENFAVNEMTLQSYRRALSRLYYSGSKPWLKQVDLTASYQQSLENRTLQKKGSATRREEGDLVQTWGFVAQAKSNWTEELSSTTGLEFYQDQVGSSRKDMTGAKQVSLRGLYPNQSRYGTFSAFTLHQLALKSWQLQAGLRYQHAIAALPDTTVGNANLSIGALVYDLGAAYLLSERTTVFAGISTGFRSPNLDDLGSLGVVDFRYELPAYALKPEYSLNKQVGIRFNTPRWKSEVVVFHTQLTNLISRLKTAEVIQGYSVYKKENVDQAYLMGFEWSQSIRLSDHLMWENGVSYTLGDNSSQKEPMRRIPPLHGHASLTYTATKGSIGLVWLFADRQDRLSSGDKSDNRMSPLGTAGWGILRLQASYKVTPRIQLGIQGENLGNVGYRMHGSGIDGMGRSLHVQAAYAW
jgi:hemoglobin/transferrin/lactoferrin receptor protein